MYSSIHIQSEIECRLFFSNTDYGVLKSDGKRYIYIFHGCIVGLRCVNTADESSQYFTIIKDGDYLHLKAEDFKKTLISSVSERDISIGTADNNGVIYSGDGKILLRCINKSIKRYKIRSGCEIICDSAFEECNKIRKIVLPDSLTHIGDCAFKNCINAYFELSNKAKTRRYQNPNTKLKILQLLILPFVLFFELVLSDFDFNIIIKHSVLPRGLKHIGNMAFYGCKRLFDISLPDCLEHIGDHAFEDCKSLSYINLPEHLTFIGSRVLSFCPHIESIKIPFNVKYICDGAFWDCFRLKSIEINDNVLGIGDRAFYGCSGMKNVSIEQVEKNVHDVERCDGQYWPVTYHIYNLSVVGENAFPYADLSSIQIPHNSKSYFEDIIPTDYHYLLKEKEQNNSLK